jgi:HPt (histidine-containing phosphotransfer) domain-containing protein
MHHLNPDTLGAYAEFTTPEQVFDFLNKVLQELNTVWPVLQAQWLAQDWAAVQHGAHRLKSLVGSVGCEILYQGLNDLETALRAQPSRWPGPEELDQLQIDVAQAKQAMLTTLQAG